LLRCNHVQPFAQGTCISCPAVQALEPPDPPSGACPLLPALSLTCRCFFSGLSGLGGRRKQETSQPPPGTPPSSYSCTCGADQRCEPRACRYLKTLCACCHNAARSDLTSAQTDCVSVSPFGTSLVLPRCCLRRLGLSPSSLLQVCFAADRCCCACNCCCLRLLAMHDTNLRCRNPPAAACCLHQSPFGLQPAAVPGTLPQLCCAFRCYCCAARTLLLLLLMLR